MKKLCIILVYIIIKYSETWGRFIVKKMISSLDRTTCQSRNELFLEEYKYD